MSVRVVGAVVGLAISLGVTACAGSDESDDPGVAGEGGSGAIAGSGSWPGNGGTSTGGASGAGNTAGIGGSGGAPTGGSGGGGGTPLNPICLGSQAGAYCGNDEMQDADANTLYQCPGAGQPPSSSTPCPAGCVVESPGTPDHCASVTSPNGYKFPWQPGQSMQLTQDCNDSCCGDHVADDGYAWDFATSGSFLVVAARGGTVTHLKINSTTGCGNSSCVDAANVIVIDHGDGTHSTYLHLQGMSLAAGVSCGGSVTQGQALATAGTTGWSTGVHLHFQVSNVHPGAGTCECGGDGTGCNAGTVPWGSFWSSPTYPTVPITFEEWPATSSCADRRITLPASQNQ